MLETLTSGSIKAAMKDADAARVDLWMVPVESIRVMEGFNVRTQNDEYEAHLNDLTESILTNGFWRDKPLSGYVAREGDENIVYVVDGHSRLEAAKRAIKQGAEIEVLPVITKPAGTQAEDLMVGLVVSNTGKPLTPIEKANVCKRLTDYGMTTATIAKRLGFTAGYVNDLLVLIAGPKKIRTMVECGSVSASNACDAIKKHGNKAVEFLESKLDVAKAAGKTKVSKAILKVKRNKVLDDGVAYIKANAGGYALIEMLSSLASVSVADIELRLQSGDAN